MSYPVSTRYQESLSGSGRELEFSQKDIGRKTINDYCKVMS
jgi:hypothetical protein